MSVLVPLAPDPTAPLARRNPVAKVAAAGIVMAGLLVTLDPVTPAVLLALELAALPFTGVRPGTLVRRTWPLLVGIAGVSLANLLVVPGGRVLLELGPVDVTSHAVSSALSVALRLLAIALPGILVLATTDPMDLADALVQRWRVPARFAYGALAALRLLPLLSADWHTIARARRARGMDAGRSPVAAGRLFASQIFAVLVSAIRRGVRLATAMEARGFDAGGPRSVARPQPMRRADWALVAAALLAVGVATAVSVAVGQWDLVVG
ncbi:MAG: energy-coupling factor transporter transmembrane component T family protein [Actinomycetes bacterium]